MSPEAAGPAAHLPLEGALSTPPNSEAGSLRVVGVAIASDIVIAVAKFVVAAVTGSSAMLTEGIHSLVDTGNELLLLYGMRRSQRVIDDEHPFGYGKSAYVGRSLWRC